jgi:hypothetical protein
MPSAAPLEPLPMDAMSLGDEGTVPPPPARSVSLTGGLEGDSTQLTDLSDARVWRVKSDSGLTYCFFSAEKLIKWVDGLSPQKNAMVSVDGLNWKSYGDFKAKYAGETEAMAALEAASEGKPAAQAAPVGGSGPSVAGPSTIAKRDPKAPARTATGLQAVTRAPAPATRAGPRPAKPQTTGERRALSVTDERPRPSDSTVAPRRANDAPSPASAGWGARLGFMAAGMLVGGAGVYFGMYLLGFYDLSFSF